MALAEGWGNGFDLMISAGLLVFSGMKEVSNHFLFQIPP